MILYYLVVATLAALLALDARNAFLTYQKSKKVLPFVIHLILLAILGAIVLNTLSVILKTQFEIPYFNYIITKKSVTVIDIP